MSNIFSKYQKELAGVKVIDSNKAWLYVWWVLTLPFKPFKNDDENGKIYPIPTKGITLPRFNGVHKNSFTNVPLAEVKNIGKYNLKRRHHKYIQKYLNK